jgi:hypothetical protein
LSFFASFLFLYLLSSFPQDGVGSFRPRASSFMLVEEFLNLLFVCALPGPLNDLDKVASVSSM